MDQNGERRLPLGARRVLAIMRATGWKQPRVVEELSRPYRPERWVTVSMLSRWLTRRADQCRIPSEDNRERICRVFPHVRPETWGKPLPVGKRSPKWGKSKKTPRTG